MKKIERFGEEHLLTSESLDSSSISSKRAGGWLDAIGNSAISVMKNYISNKSPSKKVKGEYSKSMIEVLKEDNTDSTAGMSDIDLEEI